MKAITLWQPWASCVAMGWKTIETRTHERFRCLVGQQLAIHAGMKMDEGALFRAMMDRRPALMPMEVTNLIFYINLCRGKIVATAYVLDAHWAPISDEDFPYRDDWNRRAMCEAAGKFCLFLEDIRPLRHAIFYRGSQGIFNIPDELIK